MAPLGVGMMLSGACYGANSFFGNAAGLMEDFMWDQEKGVGLRPLEAGTVNDFHDTWDLDGNDYMPQAVGNIAGEGFWSLDGNDDVQPLDV